MTQHYFSMQHGPPIPWETAETIYRAYSKLYGTSQSLERLHERGGFGWKEVESIFAELHRRHPELWKELKRAPATLPPPTEETGNG